MRPSGVGARRDDTVGGGCVEVVHAQARVRQSVWERLRGSDCPSRTYSAFQFPYSSGGDQIGRVAVGRRRPAWSGGFRTEPFGAVDACACSARILMPRSIFGLMKELTSCAG